MAGNQVLGRADTPPVEWSWQRAALGVPGIEKQLPDGRVARAGREGGPFLVVYGKDGRPLDEEIVVPAD